MTGPRTGSMALAALVAWGCAPTGPVGGPSTVAVVQVNQEPDNLNPYVSPLAVTAALASLAYSGLVALDDHGRWIPDLAVRVPTLANRDVQLERGGRMSVTYHLRPRARWHDGRPVTSADLVATWQLVMGPKFPVTSRAGYSQIAAIETPDRQTARVVYRRPYAAYLELFPFLLPAPWVGRQAPREAAGWSRAIVGSGPFRLVAWKAGDRLIYRANPGYFRGRPAIDRLEVRFISQESAALDAWRAGELDLLQGAPPNQARVLKRLAGLRCSITPSSTWEHLLFNLDHPILRERAVRVAIAQLVDRSRLIATAYNGVARPAWSEVPPYSWAYDPHVEQRYPPDLAAARRTLEAAGWHPGADGVRRKQGRRLAFVLLTTSDKPSRSLAAQIWRRHWRDAGIALTIDRQPANGVFGSADSGGALATGRFDLALVAGQARPDPDTSYRWRSDELPPHGQNRGRYRSRVVDQLLAQGAGAVDPASRRGVYQKLAGQLLNDLPVLPLLYPAEIAVTSPRLRGFRPNPTWRGNFWNAWEWKLTPP